MNGANFYVHYHVYGLQNVFMHKFYKLLLEFHFCTANYKAWVGLLFLSLQVNFDSKWPPLKLNIRLFMFFTTTVFSITKVYCCFLTLGHKIFTLSKNKLYIIQREEGRGEGNTTVYNQESGLCSGILKRGNNIIYYVQQM